MNYMGKYALNPFAVLLLAGFLAGAASVCSANSVIVDGVSPYLVPDHYQVIEDPRHLGRPSFVGIASLSIGDSTNANLGTSATHYDLGGFSVPVDEGLRAKQSDLGTVFLGGKLNLTNSGWTIGGSANKTYRSEITDSGAGAFYISKIDALSGVQIRSLAGVYHSSTATNIDTRARGIGSSFEADVTSNLDFLGSAFATWFDGDLAAIQGGLSLDLTLVLRYLADPQLQPYFGYIAQNYQSDSKHDEFSAQGFVAGVAGEINSIQILGYREHKNLNYSGVFPTIGGEQDRGRDRIGLRLSLPTALGLISLEYLDDQFSSDFQLPPADRRQIKFGLIVPLSTAL